MQKKIMDTNINFTFTDNKKEITLVLLHGWGQNIEMMEPIAKPYKNHFNILIIDLPGFGKSSEPPFPWTIYDYVECIHKLVDELKIRKVILIGHSFGGRLSLIYSSKYKVEKLTEQAKKNADINDDGTINNTDSTLLGEFLVDMHKDTLPYKPIK